MLTCIYNLKLKFSLLHWEVWCQVSTEALRHFLRSWQTQKYIKYILKDNEEIYSKMDSCKTVKLGEMVGIKFYILLANTSIKYYSTQFIRHSMVSVVSNFVGKLRWVSHGPPSSNSCIWKRKTVWPSKASKHSWIRVLTSHILKRWKDRSRHI